MAKPDRLAKNLIDACQELHRRRSWNRTQADAPFLLRVPDEEGPLAGVLMGQGGEEFGLFLLRGPEALDQLHRIFLQGDPTSSDTGELDMLSVAFDRLGEIPSEFRKTLELAGFQTRRENIAPHVIARPAHRQPRVPNKREMKTLLWCLGGLFAAEDRGELRPVPLEPGQSVLELEVSGKVREPQVKARLVPWSPSVVRDGASPVLLPAALGDLPRTVRCWIATALPLPARIEGDDRAWVALVVLDQESGEMICSELVASGAAGDYVAPLAKLLRAEGLPREIAFGQESLLDVLAPGLAALNVEVRLEPDLPVFEELRESLQSHPGFSPPPMEPPHGAETLEAWKQADREFSVRQLELIQRENLITPRALKNYFGSEKHGDRVMSKLSDLGPFPAFVEWLAADYRPTKRSKTHLERRLQDRTLNPMERTLIEARRDAVLSIFRVDSVQLGASFDVEDLLDGGRYTVQDRSLSACGIDSCFLPMRLIQVREWYFPVIAGPPLSALDVDRNLSRLESLGLSLDREGMRRNAHLVGRLWPWALEARDHPPQLQNTDGDPLDLHRARFHVADSAALAKALEKRSDVEAEEPGSDSWTWFREGGPAAGLEGRTALGRLELFDDQLLLEVNSVRRLDRAEKWLGRLPGVRFEFAERVEPGERPLDDRLPGPPPEPLPPEVLDQLRQMATAQARRWLDETVPALGGQTPRAACSTEGGRRQVIRMIRSMPPIQIPGGQLPPPREELLRELGLEG